jgi:hypothetical protein
MDELLAIPLMYAPALARYLPRFDLLLVDLSETQRDQLVDWARAVEARGARAQALMLRVLVVVRDAEALTRTLREEARALEALARDPEAQWSFDLLVSYVLVAGRSMTVSQICDILKHEAPTAASKMKTVQEMYLEKLWREEEPRMRDWLKAELTADLEAKLRVDLEAKLRVDLEAKLRVDLEAKLRAEEAKLRAEQAKLRAEQAKLRADIDAEHRTRWRSALRETLEHRFGSIPPEHEARIEAASLDELQHLVTRAATNESIEAVFASPDA